MVLDKIGATLYNALQKVVKAPVVDEAIIKEMIKDLQRSLLQADVGVQQVLDMSKRIELKSKEEAPPGVSKREVVIKAVYDELTKLVGEKGATFSVERGRSKVLMLVGIQGSGKTTTAAKIAKYVKKKGFRCALICADTYRSGASSQMRQLAEEVGVPFFEGSKNPVEIAKNGVKRFREEGVDLIILDTAGRHKEEKRLIEEVRVMEDLVRPDEVMLVIDATIGQQAFNQAKAFHDAISIGSIFLTKLDSSAKGGGAIAAVAATGATIKFVGVGEKLDDIEIFDPPNFIGRLLGMGDLRGLIERVKDAEVGASLDRDKMLAGKFTIDDMYEQLKSVQKMGPMKSLLKMLPGVGYEVPAEVLETAESKMKRWGYIIQSMRKREREDPKMIRGERLHAIAFGSGVSDQEVKELIQAYLSMKNLMKRALKSRDVRFTKLLGRFGKSA